MTNNLTTKTEHVSSQATTYSVRVRPTSVPKYVYDLPEVASCDHVTSNITNTTYSTTNTVFSSHNSVVSTYSQTSLTSSYATTMHTSRNYYGYRYYSTTLGRWINRDPILEKGGLNVYVSFKNNSINNYDILGKCSGFDNCVNVVGRNCCVACEYNKISSRIREILTTLAGLKEDPPEIPSTGGGQYLGGGICSRGLFNSRGLKPGKFKGFFIKNPESCIGLCVCFHESVHKSQCEDNPYNTYPWRKYGARDPFSVPPIEIPAYSKELKCLQSMEKSAKEKASKYGSMEEACKCCKESKNE